MFSLAVRVERAGSAVLPVVRLLAVVLAVAALLALSVGPALAAGHTDPFRWD
jgi:hypothetical protein